MEQVLQEKGLTQFYYRDGVKRYIGKISSFKNQVNAFGILDVPGNTTVVFVTDAERGSICNSFRFDNEEKAFARLLQFVEREQYIGWVHQTLDHFPDLSGYLAENYGYGRQKAEKAVAYLMQVEYIACEFVYFIEHGTFVPPHLACVFEGYTAQRLYEETSLTVLGAFNYMVYLKTKPQEALENLRKGLPSRTITSKT